MVNHYMNTVQGEEHAQQRRRDSIVADIYDHQNKATEVQIKRHEREITLDVIS